MNLSLFIYFWRLAVGIISTCSSFCLCLLKGFCVDLKTFLAFLISFCHDFYDFFLLLFSKGQQTNRGRKVFADKYQEKEKNLGKQEKSSTSCPLHLFAYAIRKQQCWRVRRRKTWGEKYLYGKPRRKIFLVHFSNFPIIFTLDQSRNRKDEKKSNYLRSPPFLKFSFLLIGKMFSTSSRFH